MKEFTVRSQTGPLIFSCFSTKNGAIFFIQNQTDFLNYYLSPLLTNIYLAAVFWEQLQTFSTWIFKVFLNGDRQINAKSFYYSLLEISHSSGNPVNISLLKGYAQIY